MLVYDTTVNNNERQESWGVESGRESIERKSEEGRKEGLWREGEKGKVNVNEESGVVKEK